MKVFVCLFAIVVCAQGGVLHHAPLLSTGSSAQSRTQDAAGNYAFQYSEQHATGGSSRSESGSPGVAQGSYTLNVADGRQRIVNYVADGLGFRAAIATNEPGTAAQPAASTAISSPHAAPVPVAPIHAPVQHADVAVAAPVAVAHAAPLLHAPVVHDAHLLAHHAPLLEHHAPVLAHHAPVLAAPVHHEVAHLPAISSYSSAVNHAAPVLHAPVLHAAPVAVAHHGLAHHGLPALAHY